MYEGSICTKAKKNNKEINVSNVTERNRAILLTGLPNKSNFSEEVISKLINDFQNWKKVRMIGSAAIAACYIASGKAERYEEKGSRY